MAVKNPPNNFPLKLNIAMQQVPLKALGPKSRDIVCDGLNQNIVTTTKNGVTRNYSGLAELTRGFEYNDIKRLSQSENPTAQLLSRWQDVPGTTIGNLLDLLVEIQRFDILDDLAPSLTSTGRTFMRFLSEEEPPSPEAAEVEQLAETMGFKFVSRASWHAFQPIRRTRMIVKKTRVVFFHHSVTLKEDPHITVQHLQSTKIIYYGHDDLDYNFLVGEDGTVFEGRGWGVVGSHTWRYNNLAISIGLLGDYEKNIPDPRMLDAALKCIELGVALSFCLNYGLTFGQNTNDQAAHCTSYHNLTLYTDSHQSEIKGKIHPNYGIYPHLDASDTNSPGRFTLEAISSWPRFRALGSLPLPEKLREMDTWDASYVESAPHGNVVKTKHTKSVRNGKNNTIESESSDAVLRKTTAALKSESNNTIGSNYTFAARIVAGDAVVSKATDDIGSTTSNAVMSKAAVPIQSESSNTIRTNAIAEIGSEASGTSKSKAKEAIRSGSKAATGVGDETGEFVRSNTTVPIGIEASDAVESDSIDAVACKTSNDDVNENNYVFGTKEYSAISTEENDTCRKKEKAVNNGEIIVIQGEVNKTITTVSYPKFFDNAYHDLASLNI